MKNGVWGNAAVLVLLLLLQNGCRFVPEKKNMDANYKKAVQLENTGTFFYHENEFDSALKFYTRSVALYKDLADSTAPPKDTLYRQNISYLYSCMSCVYDTMHNYDSALAYNIKSLGLINKWHYETEDREISNHNIALDYRKLGDLKGNQTEEGKALYRKGIPYAQAACWEIDSLGDHSDNALWAYHLAMNIYAVTGDMARSTFYQNKYNNLNIVLHLENAQNSTSQPTNNLSQKPKSNEGKSGKDVEDKFIEAFKRGFERGLNKHHSNFEYNNNNSSVSTTTDNNNGTVTTIITTISGDQETITTEVNGVVVKKETKKLN